MAIAISKEALRRIVSDLKELSKSPLTSHGIYYEHDETDVLKGRALIIGPQNTPYEDGFYLFKFIFPANYPHAPPVVTFCSNDGLTRFNPNLYRSGKVCLSILNTWHGEPWSGCQTLSSVLLAICTVFNDMPLLNEPGVSKAHHDFEKYNMIIRYRNLEFAILKMVDEHLLLQTEFKMFKETVHTHFRLKLPAIQAKIEEGAKTEPLYYTTTTYTLSALADYSALLEKLELLKTNMAK